MKTQLKDRIALIRDAANLTNEEFAKELGILKATLKNYVEGTHVIKWSVAEEMCVKFDISPTWLMLGVGEMHLSHKSTLQLFVRDRSTGRVHAVGSEQHDAVVITANGLEYENLQNGEGSFLNGSMWGDLARDEGYEWCDADGNEFSRVPNRNIGGEYVQIGSNPCPAGEV